MLALLLDNNTHCKSWRVQQIVANKLTPLERVKKGGFQIDAAEANNEVTASFFTHFYQIGGLSGSGAPVLDQLIAISSLTFRILALLLDNNMHHNSQQVQQIVARQLMPLVKKCGFQMDAAEANDKLTAGFLACFYPVHQLLVHGFPALDQLMRLIS